MPIKFLLEDRGVSHRREVAFYTNGMVTKFKLTVEPGAIPEILFDLAYSTEHRLSAEVTQALLEVKLIDSSK